MAKIASDELNHLIELGSNDPVGVLIELDLPEEVFVEVERRLAADQVGSGAVRFRRTVPKASEQQERTESINKVRQLLEEMSGVSPRWLGSSQTFVARVSPRQLRDIADLPDVKAIWPNRELRPFA
jgi:hypothetical protein